MPDETVVPIVGGAVMVTFYTANHVLKSAVAHVLAISGATAGLATEDGYPALTVAYPNPDASPAVLSSASWQYGFIRQTGVLHSSHKLTEDGSQSIVWGHALPQDQLPFLLQPEGVAANPIFDRAEDPAVLKPSIEAAMAVQTGIASQPTVISPLINEGVEPAVSVEPSIEAATPAA